jgi:hypothetical protein
MFLTNSGYNARVLQALNGRPVLPIPDTVADLHSWSYLDTYAWNSLETANCGGDDQSPVDIPAILDTPADDLPTLRPIFDTQGCTHLKYVYRINEPLMHWDYVSTGMLDVCFYMYGCRRNGLHYSYMHKFFFVYVCWCGACWY